MKKYRTEKEILFENQVALFKLEKELAKEKFSIKELGEILPGMLHLNRSEDLVLSYFNLWAEDRFEKSVEEITKQGLEFMVSIFEPGTAFFFRNSILRFVEMNDKNSVHGLFQKVRFNPSRDYEWMYTSSKIFDDGTHVFSYSSPIGNIEAHNTFLLRHLEDNLFLRKNFTKFQSLNKREKQVLKLIAIGMSTNHIAQKLCLSPHTVSTHRKNIKRKLDFKSIMDWEHFVHVFAL